MITMATGPKAKVVRNLLKTLLDASSIRSMMSNIKGAVDTTDELFHKAANNDQADIDVVR